MDDQKIRCFLETAHTLSFTKAADRLFISQSAVSRSVHALEDELGITLFDRNSKNVVLTPAGKVMMDGLEPIMQRMSALHKQALLVHQGSVGEIRVGLPKEFMVAPFMMALNSFEKAHPDIPLSVITETVDGLSAKLFQNEVDFAIGCRHDMGLVTEPHIDIGKRRVGLAISTQHPLAEHEGRLCLADFKDDVFAVLPDSSAPAKKNLIIRCKRLGFTPNVLIVPDVSTIMLQVVFNKCVSILYDSASIQGNEYIKFLEMDEIEPVTASINWLDNTENRNKQVFIDYFLKYNWNARTV
jgi:DNA-binding transcriptional LysR family regulator